jgi:transposase
MTKQTRRSRFSPEVRERAVRLVQDRGPEYGSQWAAIRSIAEKIGCSHQTLRSWVQQAERDTGQRPGLSTADRQRLRELERENLELRRANEILRKASAFFAQAELDRRPRCGVRNARMGVVVQSSALTRTPWLSSPGRV